MKKQALAKTIHIILICIVALLPAFYLIGLFYNISLFGKLPFSIGVGTIVSYSMSDLPNVILLCRIVALTAYVFLLVSVVLLKKYKLFSVFFISIFIVDLFFSLSYFGFLAFFFDIILIAAAVFIGRSQKEQTNNL